MRQNEKKKYILFKFGEKFRQTLLVYVEQRTWIDQIQSKEPFVMMRQEKHNMCTSHIKTQEHVYVTH